MKTRRLARFGDCLPYFISEDQKEIMLLEDIEGLSFLIQFRF